MISKVFITGQTFAETCRYVFQETKLSKENRQKMKQLDVLKAAAQELIPHGQTAQVLYSEGVRGHNYRLMAADFELQHQFNPIKEKPVFHGMLSFPPGENPGHEKMVQVARLYLEEIGMTNTQVAIVQHSDKDHLHLHILANRVNNKGQIIGKGLIAIRGMRAAKKLTRQFGLTPESTKNLKQTNLASLHKPDRLRYRLYELIRDHLPGCINMEDLEQRLLQQGVSTRYRTDRVTGQRQGISFRIEQYCFGGSKVDPAYSLRNLEKTLTLQQGQEQNQEHKQELQPTLVQNSPQPSAQNKEQNMVHRLLNKKHRKPKHAHGHDLGLGL